MTPHPGAGAEVRRNLVYSPEHGLALDLHPADDAGAPVVLYVHGGGFARGTRSDDERRIGRLAALGLTIASIDYRLAPQHRYPAPVDDALAAARFLRETAAELGIPDAPVGAIGASAGGYIVSMAALSGSADIGAASPWFAPSDLWSSSRRTALEELVAPVTYEQALLGRLDEASLREASPVRRPIRNPPPFLLLHGDDDRIVPPAQSAFLHDALTRAGSDSLLVRVGGTGHEGDAFDRSPLLDLVAAWFRAALRSPD